MLAWVCSLVYLVPLIPVTIAGIEFYDTAVLRGRVEQDGSESS